METEAESKKQCYAADFENGGRRCEPRNAVLEKTWKKFMESPRKDMEKDYPLEPPEGSVALLVP